MEWNPNMDEAPRDGTVIKVHIPGYGSDNTVCWIKGFVDSNGNPCGGWAFVDEREPPDCWTDGVCWEVNEDGVPSIKPIKWRLFPLPPEADNDKG